MAILTLLALLLFTGLLVAIEMAVFSARREKLMQSAAAGDGRAEIVLGYQADPPRFLGATQIVVTLVTVLTGAVGEDLLRPSLMAWIQAQGVRSAVAHDASFWGIVVGVTLASLVLANMFPKHIGFVAAEGVSLTGARFSRLYVAVLRPVSWLLDAATRGLARVFRIPLRTPNTVTEGDIETLLDEGLETGGIDPQEREIAHRVFRLSDRVARDVMTPREKVVFLDAAWNAARIRSVVAGSGRSFLPVVKGDLDHVVGILKARDYLALAHPTQGAEFLGLLAPVLRVPPNCPLVKLTTRLRDSAARVALVADARGRLMGLVTLNDVVTNVVGRVRSIDE